MPRLLGEFLHEQQEPFALDTYLLERGYSARTSSRINRARSFEEPLSCTEFAKAVFGRLVSRSSSGKRKIKNPDKSCYVDLFSRGMVDEDREDNNNNNNKQLSPVSVLEETESDIDEGSSPFHDKNHKCNKTVQGESSSTSVSGCKQEKPTHIHRRARECQELIVVNDSYDQYMINKKIMRQTNQLLIDCVREVIEQHRKKGDGGSGLKKILGTDELWKRVCDNVWLWSRDSVHDQSSTTRMISHDIMACAREWISHPGLEKEDMSMEIGDAILEGIIDETFC